MKPPKTIYLQTDEEAEQYSYEGVTWCVDQINTNDKQYILSTPEREAASDLLKACLNFMFRLEQIAESDPTLDREIDDEFAAEIMDIRAAIAQATKDSE